LESSNVAMAFDPPIPEPDDGPFSAFQSQTASLSSTSSPNSQAQGATPATGTVADAEKSTTPDIGSDGRSRESTVPAACLACVSHFAPCHVF
jgi:hypothetical protein